MDVRNELGTKERIIKVTMELIASEGFQNVTIRKIANQADVNLAAVNYHFGSKDAVINEALKTVMAQLINAFSQLKDAGTEPRERLRLFIIAYSNVLFKYPDIIKIIIDQIIHNYPNRVEPGYHKYLKEEGSQLLINTLTQIYPEEADTVLKMKTLQLLSCMAFPILMGDTIIEVIDLELEDLDTRQIYIDLLLDNV